MTTARVVWGTLALAVMASALPARVQAQADTLAPASLFTYRDALLAGAILGGARLVHPLDARLASALQDSSTQDSRRLQKLAVFVRTTAAPGSYYIGGTLYLVGRAVKNPQMADVGLHGTEALLVGEAFGALLKRVVGRARPHAGTRRPNDFELFRGFSSDDFRSMPSGHAASGFAAAAAVTSEMWRFSPETRWLVGPVLYGGAAMVGASRMFNNRHWASDVIVGAGIGTFAGLKVVRYHHTRPGNPIDRLLLAGSIVPSDGGGHAVRWMVLPDLRTRTR